MDMKREMEGVLLRTTWLLWTEGVTPLDIRRRLSVVCGDRERERERERARACGSLFNWEHQQSQRNGKGRSLYVNGIAIPQQSVSAKTSGSSQSDSVGI